MDKISKIPTERIEQRIFLIRGQKVMLSIDLASLYDVEHKVLMQAVRRNHVRFPPDFAFQLTDDEWSILKSQFVTSSWGGIRKLPYAFTEHGILMLSTVLKSERAVQVNIAIMRTFVRLRAFLASNEELARKFEILEKKYDEQFKIVFTVLRKLFYPPKEPYPQETKPKGKIGFQIGEQVVRYKKRTSR